MALAQLSAFPLLMMCIAGVFGAAVGSFLTLITYRLPLEQQIGLTRSQCTTCKSLLGIRDLVPLLSWMVWGGKCRQCRAPISIRYPLTEFACAAGAVFSVYYYGASLEAVAIAGLWWCIVAIFVTDLEHYIILDEVQIATALFGALYVYVQGIYWYDAFLAACAGVAVGLVLKYGFILACKKDGLGMGDVKFLGAAGIWLSDAANFVPFLFYSGVLGIISGIAWRLITKSERFPFGPALALSLLLCVLFPSVPNGFWKLYGALQ